MARALVAQMPDCALYVDYNANNRRVNGLAVANTTGHDVYAEARWAEPLAGANVWGRNFPVGDTLMNLPANLLTYNTYTDEKGETQTGVLPAPVSIDLSLLR